MKMILSSKKIVYALALFVMLASSSCSKHLSYTNPTAIQTLPTPREISNPIEVALVLGGGGARGMAHLGVIEELEKAGIKIDLIVGCSIGSLIGSIYADDPNAEVLKEKVFKIKRRHLARYNPFKSRKGIWQTKHLNQYLNKILTAKTFEELKIPLYIVATDMLNGKKVSISGGDLIDPICASSAVPFFFQPKPLYGRLLADGGMVDPTPTEEAVQLGAKLIIAVDVSGNIDNDHFKNNIYHLTKRGYHIMNITHTRRSCESADVIIKPNISSDLKFFDDKNLKMVYEAGRAATIEAMDEIKEKINNL